MAKHLDFSKFYISTVDEVEPGERYGYNVQIIRVDPAAHGVGLCDLCGDHEAEYMMDPSEDLGIASTIQAACQICMMWSFNNTHETGELFHQKG